MTRESLLVNADGENRVVTVLLADMTGSVAARLVSRGLSTNASSHPLKANAKRLPSDDVAESGFAPDNAMRSG